jgi:hypothetical protein
MVKQVVYTAERAQALMPREGPALVKFLINTQGGGFRMPDADYRAAVFDVLHQYYPWMESSQVIFLDPLYVVKMALWGMGKIFGPSWKQKFVVGSKAAWPEGVKDPDVEKYMETTPGGKALGWEADGTIRYDMEEYIERRKSEERKKAPQEEGQTE